MLRTHEQLEEAVRVIRPRAIAAGRSRGGLWHRHIHPAKNSGGCLCHEAAVNAALDLLLEQLREVA